MKKTEIKQEDYFENYKYGKLPPQAIDLEKMVLGAMIAEPRCIHEVIGQIKSFVFYLDAHQKIFNAITELYDNNTHIDIHTIVATLKKVGDLELVGGAYYVVKLTNDIVSTAHIDSNCKILIEMYLKRELIRISGISINEAFDDSTDAFDLYDNADNSIIKAQESVLGGKIDDISTSAMKVHDEYEKVEISGVLGIPTGLLKLDQIFCGLVAPDLLVIAARPGMGKTALALSITYNCSVINQIPCAWFSYEMDSVQLTRRLISIDSKVSHKKIREGKVDNHLKQQFFNAIDRVSKSPIFIEDGSLNIRALRTRAHILKRKHNIQFIIVDYLQLMPSLETKSGSKNREGEVSEISRGLKMLAKELKIPIIALSQLSRKVEERADKMPQLSDLRESGAIEQDADGVLFLMRPEYYEMTEDVKISGKEYNVKDLTICKGAKNRHGSADSMAFIFESECMYFTNHPNDISNFTPF